VSYGLLTLSIQLEELNESTIEWCSSIATIRTTQLRVSRPSEPLKYIICKGTIYCALFREMQHVELELDSISAREAVLRRLPHSFAASFDRLKYRCLQIRCTQGTCYIVASTFFLSDVPDLSFAAKYAAMVAGLLA